MSRCGLSGTGTGGPEAQRRRTSRWTGKHGYVGRRIGLAGRRGGRLSCGWLAIRSAGRHRLAPCGGVWDGRVDGALGEGRGQSACSPERGCSWQWRAGQAPCPWSLGRRRRRGPPSPASSVVWAGRAMSGSRPAQPSSAVGPGSTSQSALPRHGTALDPSPG